MQIMNLLRNKRIYKRGLSLLLAVMVLISAVNILMVSVLAEGYVYSGEAYTVITNAVNFNSNGKVIYTIKRKKPVYKYEFIYDENGNPVQVEKTVTNTWTDEYEYAVCEPMMNGNTQMRDANDNLVWEVKDNVGNFGTMNSSVKIGDTIYTDKTFGTIGGSYRIEGDTAYRRNIIIKNGDNWQEIVVRRTGVTVTETDPETGEEISKNINVWEYVQDYVPAVSESDASVALPVPSDNGKESYTIRIASSTPVEVTLKGEINSAELLFMDMENGNPDSVQPESQTAELDVTSNTAEFTVQYPEHQDLYLRKIWQDNGTQKTGLSLNIGVKYKDKDENGNEKDVVLIGAAPPAGSENRIKNEDENAEFFRSSETVTTWTYYLGVDYIYNSDGSPRNFELYESEIPEGYIQQKDENGNLINIKTEPFEATITWLDADNKYGSRPDPEMLEENIKNLVYKRSEGGNEQKINDVTVLCKAAYQPKKTKIKFAQYKPLETSVYLTHDEINGYNNEVALKNNDAEKGFNAANPNIDTYNNDVIVYSANTDHPDTAPNNFQYTEPKLEDFGNDVFQYNLAVEEYNNHVLEYNNSVEEFNHSSDAYNATVEAYNTAIDHRLNDANDLRNAEEVVVITLHVDNTWTISIPHAMSVNSNNKNYSYYIKSTDGTTNLMDNLIPDSADDNGIDHENDSYSLSISNNGNNASFMDDIYNKADVKATLTGETEFSVYKYWGDNNDGDRPECEFEIYHYSDVDGKSYAIATAMPKADFQRPVISDINASRDQSITKYVFKKGSASLPTPVQNSDYEQFTCDVALSSIPKFDATGRMYIYYVKEVTLKGAENHSYSPSRDTTYENSPYKADEHLPNNYALNGDTLGNVLSGNTSNTVTKTWKAEARQDRSDKASFIIDQYSYMRDGNTSNYQTEDYTTLTQVDTEGHEKMYLLYEMVQVNGDWKYKVKVSYKDDDKDYSGYNYYSLDEITVDERTQNIFVSSYTYTDDEGNTHTVNGSFYGEFAHRYVDDIYQRDNNGNIITDTNNKPLLSCREEELVRTLKTENNSTSFVDTKVRVLKKTETNGTEYYLYKYGIDTTTNEKLYDLNYGGEIIHRKWSEISSIDPANDTAKTTIVVQVNDDDVNDPILAQAKLQELAHWRSEHSVDWTPTDNIEHIKTANNSAIYSLTLQLQTLTNNKNTAQAELETLKQEYNTINSQLQNLQQQKTDLEATNPHPEDYGTQLADLESQINDKQNELSEKGTEREAKQTEVNNLNSQIETITHDLTLRRTYRNKITEVEEKTIEDYVGVTLEGEDIPITVVKKNQPVEIDVKLVYNTVDNIYVLNLDNTIRYENGLPILQAQYEDNSDGTGNVVWLDEQHIIPKSTSAVFHHGEKVLDGFSQDVKTKTENINMPRYDNEGYEYFYKVYEDNIKTKDDAEYSKVELVTDETGTYRIITTDKGYQYESREVIDDGNSIVTNTLIGKTYASTTKRFSGYFLPKSYTTHYTGNVESEENITGYTLNISPPQDYAVEYIVYRDGVNLGTALMYFKATDNNSHFKTVEEYAGSKTTNVPKDQIVYADYPQYERDEKGKIRRNDDGTPVYQYEKNPDGSYKLDENGNKIVKVKREPVIEWNCSIQDIYKTNTDLLSHSGNSWTVNTSSDNFVVNPNSPYASEIEALFDEQINYAQGNQNKAIPFPRYNENGAIYIYDIREIGMYPITSWNDDGTPNISGTEAGFGSDNEILNVVDYEIGDGKNSNYAYSTVNDRIDNVTSGEYDYQEFRVYKEYRDENQQLYRRNVTASLQYCVEYADGVAKWVNVTSNDNQTDGSQSTLLPEFTLSQKERSFYYKFTKYPYDEFGTRIDDSYSGTGGVKIYKGTLIPGSSQTPDEEGLGYYDPTSDDESELIIDVYRKWLNNGMKKVAYDRAEVQQEMGALYDENAIYYYNKDYKDSPTNSEPKFTSDVSKAAAEDRAYYKSADGKGNFRVIERAVIDGDGTRQEVQHENTLLANKLLLYLLAHKADIAQNILDCRGITKVSDFCTNNHINSSTDTGTMEQAINEFLNTHDDDSIINWIKNHVPTSDDQTRITSGNSYADLTSLLKLITANYINSLSDTDKQDFLKYYKNLKHADLLSNPNDWSGEYLEGIITVYKDYLLDKFCEEHPEHHKGNSFVATNEQNYDVSNIAELSYDVPEELKSPFEFALFNTRVGAQKMDIKMEWTDGNNQHNVRPDALKCMVTASEAVFGDYSDEQLTAIGMERVQAVDKDGFEIWDCSGVTYYSKDGKYYDSSKNEITSLPDSKVPVWDNTKVTIMLTPSDENNKNSEWIYSGTKSYLPKYTFANPSEERSKNPSENAETYGSKDDGTSISYSVSAIGYYEKVGDKYIPWSSNVISYSGPSLHEDYPQVDLGKHGNYYNHTNDVYHYVYLGAASGSVNLVINKYWMDTVDRDTARPEIHFDLYRSYVDSDGKLHVENTGTVFPPLNDSNIGVDDSKWWSTSLNMPKYTGEGYQIDYYAVERENVDGSFEITGYDETENFVGMPTRFYVKQDGKAYYSVNYNNSETIKIGNATYNVQYYQCVDVNGSSYEISGDSVTINGFTRSVQEDEKHFKYINYPTDDDKRYYLRNSSNLKIVDIDGIDYPVTNNKIKYGNDEYGITYYLKLDNNTTLLVTVSGNRVYNNNVELIVVDDMVRYDGKYYQLDGDVTVPTADGEKTYHLVKPTRRYIEIGGKKYGLRDSTDDYSDQKDYSDILNYEESSLLDRFCVIKTGTMQNQGQTLIKKNQNAVPSDGYIKAAALEFNETTGSYNVGTVVNRPIAKRTLDGNKVWKPESLPKFNSGTYEVKMLPNITLTIYRYTYDEIHEMRAHDVAIEEALGDNPTDEQKADAEARMLLKPVKTVDGIAPASERKYPKSVNSSHLVTVDKIKSDKNGNDVDINDKKYSVTVRDLNGDVIGEFPNKYQAVIHEFISEEQEDFKWEFNFDNNSFDKFDSRGKPYTYVLHEGYTTNIEVWRWKENETPKKEEKIYTEKIVGITNAPEGVKKHTGNIVLDTGITREDGYRYEARLVEGTDSLDESYTFAYDLEQSSDQLDITNLYNMDQSLSIKLKKLWKGLPENLSPSEYPTTTFKLVRYLQDDNGNKITSPNTKEDVLFKSDDFNLQEYVSIGESKIFLENKQEVEINNYDIKYPVDIEGNHLAYNDMTKVYTDTSNNQKYVNIAGVRYNVADNTVIVGSDVYNIENYNGEEYIKIDVRASDVKKYVVVDNVNTYLGELNGVSTNKFVINGIEYDYDENNSRIAYSDSLKVKNKTFTAVNEKIEINGNKYAVNNNTIKISGKTYTLTSSGEANKYRADCVTIGNKDYLILTDASNVRYIKTGTEYYYIVTDSGNDYVQIDVREIDYDRYVSWNYGKYSLVDTDNQYYAKIGSNCYDIIGTSPYQHIEIPVNENGTVRVNGIDYSVANDIVTIGENEYSVADGKMIVPIQSSKGYRYNYETDAEDNIISVEVAYTGEAESEIELKWNNLPYYAPNMRPYIYDIEELGVTNGFSVSTLSDNGSTDYENNLGGLSHDLTGTESSDSTDEIGKNDYVTNIRLDPNNKKDKTTLNVGLSNNYDSTKGAIKVQKLWENDTDYEVSPRPSSLNVTLYRTFYDTYVTINGKSYPVERQQYIELKDENNLTNRYYVDKSSNTQDSISNYYVEVPAGNYKIINTDGKEMTIPVEAKKYPVQEGKIVLYRYVEYPEKSGKICDVRTHIRENGKPDYYYIQLENDNKEYVIENGRVLIDKDYFYVKNVEVEVNNLSHNFKIGDDRYVIDEVHVAYDNATRIKSNETITIAGITAGINDDLEYIKYNDEEYYVQTGYLTKYVVVDDAVYYVESVSGMGRIVRIGSAICEVNSKKYVQIGDDKYDVVETSYAVTNSDGKEYLNYNYTQYPVQNHNVNIEGDNYYVDDGYVKIKHIHIPVCNTPQNITDGTLNKVYNSNTGNDTNKDIAVSKGDDVSNAQDEHTAVDMDETYPENPEEQTVELPPEPFELVGTYRGSEWTENVIKNLPIYSPNGRKYYYYIVENEVPTGYTQTMYSAPVAAVDAKNKQTNVIDKSKLNLTQIQNTLVPTKAKAKKQWLDTSNSAWSDEEMLFASKLSGIAQSITYRMAYSTTDYQKSGNYSNAVWSSWDWLKGDSVEIDGRMYYPDTNPHENNNKQYIRVDSDVIIKNDNDDKGDYICIENGGKKYYIKNNSVEVGGVTYTVKSKDYIQATQDIPVKSDIIDGKLIKYVEFSVSGEKKKYDVDVTLNAQGEETSAKVTIGSDNYNVTTQKYVTVPYDAEVITAGDKQWIAFTVDGQPYKYEVKDNAVKIGDVTYPLQTKNTNVKYIVIEHDTNVQKDNSTNKEYIEVYVDGISTRRELNSQNEVELNDVSYLANKRQYITGVQADVLTSNVLFTQNGAVKIGYTNGDKIHVDSVDYTITQQNYVNILADVEVQNPNGQKYVTYTDNGEYKTYFIDEHVEKTMALSQEKDAEGNFVAKFNDIEWSSADGDKLPEYIRVDGTLKKVRYMPIEYSLSYTKTNYQDGSKTKAEYNRNGSDNSITDEQILNALNSSTNGKDTFSMGFVNGETDFKGDNTSETKNTVGRMKITIIKDWGDDFNRDDYRGDFTLDFKITRSNINYVGDTQEVTVTLKETDAYTYTDEENEEQENPNIWIKSYYVPITSNFNEHILSKYTVEELGPSNSVYQTDFNNYTNFTSTGIYVENGQNATDVQNLSISDKGRKSEVGTLHQDSSVSDFIVQGAPDTVSPVDRYAAFKNTKERLEFSLTPSKLWYNINGDMYPSKDEDEHENVMPEWAKNIFFPDGNPDNLRIRFKLQYQISDDENADKDKWLYVTDDNEEYKNAKSDLAGIEPYLEFTVNEKGEISPVMHEKWDNLPKHYYTEEIKTHKNYLYRVQEVLVRNLETKEVSVSDMYICLDSSDLTKHTAITDNNGTLQVTVHNDDTNADEVKTLQTAKIIFILSLTAKNTMFRLKVTESTTTLQKKIIISITL